MSRLELHVPASGSLKTKRHVVKGIVGGLRAKFNVAAAEVAYQDLWQRTAIAVTCVSESPSHAEQMLHEVERFVARDSRVVILSNDMQVFQPEDE